MRLFSPAKVNLFLRVERKRGDGYHDLASLFQAISLGDCISFSLNEKDFLSCTDPHVPVGPNNLIWQAANLFRRKTGLSFGLCVHLEKNLPMQSGLGGGSSNAATTLWALNQMWGRPATDELLALWAAEIGSDISFFFSQGTAYCTGRGERVAPLSLPSQPPPMWIIKPLEGLSTPHIFKIFDLSKREPREPLESLEEWRRGKICTYNDLEKPAFEQLPLLKTLREELVHQGYQHVTLTGSGTSFFCFGEKKPSLPDSIYCQRAHFLERTPDGWY